MVEELCPRCNKIKSLRIESEQEPRSYFFNEWCTCPDVKHDGNLDTGEVGCEEDTVSHYLQGIAFNGNSAGYFRMHYYLTAKQALSLLEWLQQNKSVLEKIAQEG